MHAVDFDLRQVADSMIYFIFQWSNKGITNSCIVLCKDNVPLFYSVFSVKPLKEWFSPGSRTDRRESSYKLCLQSTRAPAWRDGGFVRPIRKGGTRDVAASLNAADSQSKRPSWAKKAGERVCAHGCPLVRRQRPRA